MPIPNVAAALGTRRGIRTDGRELDTGDLRGVRHDSVREVNEWYSFIMQK
ncbi:hypothetical protein GCM10009747_30830 [Agromyces humatus]|uniref:Uncharacterized protein n=1 Tax=Agromyces humatus TaxID=279573 RepID=A0ABP4X187_9MICO